jgi:hypothetical protein
MKRLMILLVLGALLFGCGAATLPSLSADERNAGWELLFDGQTFNGWRGYKMEQAPPAWKVTKNGELYFSKKGKGGDLMTVEQYGSFELQLEWKIAKGGNSGIFFWVSEDKNSSYETGPEMQVLDNAHHKDGGNTKTSAGSNYALHEPVRSVTRPIGEYNTVRLVVNGTHIEHWLNGVKIVEYEIGSPDWEARVAASKFATMPGYGRNRQGHIVLQDHGDKVWYRNIRIRPL